MAKASDNVFPRFLISEGGSTATPAAGRVTVYAKADGLLYSKDDAGAETALGGSAASFTTVDGQQGADIALSAATYTNLTSVSLVAGTWDIWGWASFTGVTATSDQYAQIWDGSAQLGQAVTRNANIGSGGSDHLQVTVFAASVVLGSTTTIYLRGYSDLATTAVGSTSLGTGGGSKIHAMKIA